REAWERNLYARPDELLRLIFRGLCGTGPGAAAHGRYTAQLTSSRDLPETLATVLESRELWEAIIRCQPGQIVASACRSLLQGEREHVTCIHQHVTVPGALGTAPRTQDGRLGPERVRRTP